MAHVNQHVRVEVGGGVMERVLVDTRQRSGHCHLSCRVGRLQHHSVVACATARDCHSLQHSPALATLVRTRLGDFSVMRELAAVVAVLDEVGGHSFARHHDSDIAPISHTSTHEVGVRECVDAHVVVVVPSEVLPPQLNGTWPQATEMPRSCHRQHYCSIPLSQPYRMTYLVRAASPQTAPGHLYMAAWLCACSLQMRSQRDTHLGSDFQRRSRDPLCRSAYPQEPPVTPPQRRYKWLRTPPRSSLRRLPSCHDSVFPHVHPQTHTHARIGWVKLGERDTSVARRPMVGWCQGSRSGKTYLHCVLFLPRTQRTPPTPAMAPHRRRFTHQNPTLHAAMVPTATTAPSSILLRNARSRCALTAVVSGRPSSLRVHAQYHTQTQTQTQAQTQTQTQTQTHTYTGQHEHGGTRHLWTLPNVREACKAFQRVGNAGAAASGSVWQRILQLHRLHVLVHFTRKFRGSLQPQPTHTHSVTKRDQKPSTALPNDVPRHPRLVQPQSESARRTPGCSQARVPWRI